MNIKQVEKAVEELEKVFNEINGINEKLPKIYFLRKIDSIVNRITMICQRYGNENFKDESEKMAQISQILSINLFSLSSFEREKVIRLLRDLEGLHEDSTKRLDNVLAILRRMEILCPSESEAISIVRRSKEWAAKERETLQKQLSDVRKLLGQTYY